MSLVDVDVVRAELEHRHRAAQRTQRRLTLRRALRQSRRAERAAKAARLALARML